MRSLDAAACSCWLFCLNLDLGDFGTLCPEVPASPGPACFSEPAPKAEPPGSAALPPGSVRPVCVQGSGPGLFGFRFVSHILRAGGQQVVDLPLGETVNKRDGHIPVKQQALAGIRVGDVGKLVLGMMWYKKS